MYDKDEGKIQNKTIKITKVEDGMISTGTKKKKITDQDGKNYTFFLHTKEGIKTKTFEQYEAMELGVGSVVRIGFVIESFTLKAGKDAGKEVKVNKVISFSEAFDEGRASVEQPQGEAAQYAVNGELDREMDNEFDRAIAQDKAKPKAPQGNQGNNEQEIWEAKDRLHAAQTAINAAATVISAFGTTDLPSRKVELLKYSESIYEWLIAKKAGTETSNEEMPPMPEEF